MDAYNSKVGSRKRLDSTDDVFRAGKPICDTNAAHDDRRKCLVILEEERDYEREWEFFHIVTYFSEITYTHVVLSVETNEPSSTAGSRSEQDESDINTCNIIRRIFNGK